MSNPYQDAGAAIKYLDFLNSTNGNIQREVLLGAILPRLPKNTAANVLDAACGPGWLAGALKKKFSTVFACDSSKLFVKFASVHFKGVNFSQGDLGKSLPYQNNFFDFIVLNMAAPDLANIGLAFKNLAAVLKPRGKLILTIPNPVYSYPAAEWKRGDLDFLFFRKPKLKLKTPPPNGTPIQREFGKNSKISSFYYSLDGYLSAAKSAGLELNFKQEIKSQTDSKNFDLTYQLYRYPLFLLLEFEKIR